MSTEFKENWEHKLQKMVLCIIWQAHARMDVLTEQMRAAEGVIEELKSQD